MQNYIRQLGFEDSEIAKNFIEIIRDVVRKEVRRLNFNRMYPAEVVSVSGNTANIKLMDGEETISGIKNKTGEALSIGDGVYIEAINNSLNNIYIAVKK